MLAPHKAGEACKNRGSDHGQAGAFYRTWGGCKDEMPTIGVGRHCNRTAPPEPDRNGA